MTESIDPILSAICAHCGKYFHRRRYVNRYTTVASVEVLGKPAPAKYCSPGCRKNAYRQRRQSDATHLDVPFPQVGASHAPTPMRAADAVPFESIRADRLLSRWEPTACAPADDPGWEIPDFLRRV